MVQVLQKGNEMSQSQANATAVFREENSKTIDPIQVSKTTHILLQV